MALNARELELIIIAKDRASSTLARVGGALTIMGSGVTALGIRWGREMREMAMEAAEFSNSAALAFSQMFDKTGASVEDVNDMMTRVARDVARPVDEMGEALFDIFSSIDVNVPEAEHILRKVGEAAVAGQADMRSAMVPTIAMMNAFNLGVDDIDRILDIQFKTVQKGIVTYDEFTQNIGKVIPAARAAGQDLESMGSAYSFLTRQGLNASMASTSVARAFELLARPQSVANLEEIGVTVRDQQGEFLQMSDIIQQLGTRFEDMTAPERKQAFEDIFGTARIQARRFFDVAIPNYEDFVGLQDDFQNSAGAMGEAYDIMFDEPMAKLQILLNRWQMLRKEIGDRIIPILEEHVAPLLERILDAWEDLTDEQKDTVAEWLALGSVATSVFGALTTFIGLVTLAAGIWRAFGVGIATILTTAGKALGILGLIAGAAFLIWQHWDDIVRIWEERVLPVLEDIWEFLEPLVEGLVELATGTALSFWERLVDAWETLKEIGLELWENLDVEEGLRRWREAWELLGPIVEQAFQTIGAIIETAGEILGAIIDGIVGFLKGIWNTFGDDIIAIAQAVWDAIPGIVLGGLTMILGILKFFEGLFTGDWEKMWEGIKTYFRGAIMQWVAIFQLVWAILVIVAKALWREFEERLWKPFLARLEAAWERLWPRLVEFFTETWVGRLLVAAGRFFFLLFRIFVTGLGLIRDLWRVTWQGVAAIFSRAWELMRIGASVVWGAIERLAQNKWVRIAAFILNPILAAIAFVLIGIGRLLSNLGGAWDTVKRITETAWLAFKGFILNPINAVMSGFAGFVENIVGKLEGLWDKVSYWVGKIRDSLQKINPAEWFSPPLTQQVAEGFKTLTSQVIGDLKYIEREANTRVGRIRGKIREIDASRAEMARAQQAASRAASGGNVNYNVDVHTQARDGQQVANELAWKLRLT